jgi:hypothetical protein
MAKVEDSFTMIPASTGTIDTVINKNGTAASTAISSAGVGAKMTATVPYDNGYQFFANDYGLEDCQRLCLADNNMAVDANGNLVSGVAYYPRTAPNPLPAGEAAGMYDPSELVSKVALLPGMTPTYRCAGVLSGPSQCMLVTSGALPVVAEDAGPGDTSTLVYYDLDCQHSGARRTYDTDAQRKYCVCNPLIAEDGEHTHAMYEGERCTVPNTFLHSNNFHSSFYRTDENFYHPSASSPAQQRWRGHLGDHPGQGYLLSEDHGQPYPLAAHVAHTSVALVDPTTPVPPAPGFSSPASTSGNCGNLELDIPDSACATFNTGQEGSCPVKTCCASGSCPLPAPPPSPAPPPATGAATSRTDQVDGTGAVGSSVVTGHGTIKLPVNADVGTPKTPTNPFCKGNNCQSGCADVASAQTVVCTSEPKSFQIAAKAYNKCIANGRAMIKQDGVDRNDVSTWSQAQQNSLNQLLSSSANGTCVTHYSTDSGVSVSLQELPLGVGVDDSTSLDTGAVGCESLFDTCNALSEYNATLNCTLNSAQNCQANLLCNSLSVNLTYDAIGDFNTVTIDQQNAQNLNASANYTNEFSNHFANNTTQSLQSLISQFSSQLAQTEATLGTPIAGGALGQAPAQGAREFAQTAAAISNVTENAVSNQISNSQITDVTNQETITATVRFVGNNNNLAIKQSSTQDVQTKEITQNQVNNSFSNTTSQVLTSDTHQGDEVKRAIGLIMLVFFIILLLAGAVVAAVFIGKLAKKGLKKGRKLMSGFSVKRAGKKATPTAAGSTAAGSTAKPAPPPPPKKRLGAA